MGACFRGEKVMAWNHGLRSVAGLSAADMGLVGTWSRFLLFHRLVSDLLRNAIIDFISLLLLLLLLFFLVVSEEDSERMRKNKNNNKRSDTPSDFVLSGKKYSEGQKDNPTLPCRRSKRQ